LAEPRDPRGFWSSEVELHAAFADVRISHVLEVGVDVVQHQPDVRIHVLVESDGPVLELAAVDVLDAAEGPEDVS
jgi:hypothetical protein